MTVSAFTPIKPDRYQDWQRQWSDSHDYHWVNIIVEVVNGDKLRENLERLLALLTEPASPKPGEPQNLRASADEIALLRSIVGKTKDPDKLCTYQRIFFLYLQESEVFDPHGGGFIDRGLYQTLYAGPPLEGLDLGNMRVGAPSQIASINPPVAGGSPLIGIIDYGIGFANERFRTSDPFGRPRVRALWVQRLEESDDSGNVAIGRRYDSNALEEAVCGHEDRYVYQSLGLLDFGPRAYGDATPAYLAPDRRNSLSQRVTHGTHVLDLAAGEQPGTQDNDDILAVELPPEAAADTSGVTMASYVLQGLRQLMLWADTIDREPGATSDRPLIVNFSFGITAGPKDGGSTFEKIVEMLISSRPNTFVMLPAGNHKRGRLTANVDVLPERPQVLEWLIRPDDRTPSFVEIWSQPVGGDCLPYAIKLTAPGGECLIAPMTGGEACELQPADATAPWAAVYTDRDPETHRWRVFLAVGPTADYEDHRVVAPMGSWKITFESTSRRPVCAWVFVQRDETPIDFYRDGRQSTLDHPDAYEWDESFLSYSRLGSDGPLTEKTSLTAIGTGASDRRKVIGGAVNESLETAAPYSASGPVVCRDGPNYSAIVDMGWAHRGVLASGTLSGTTAILSGTSVAAPQAARAEANKEAKGEPEIAGGRSRLPPRNPDDRRHLIGDRILPLPEERGLTRRRPLA